MVETHFEFVEERLFMKQLLANRVKTLTPSSTLAITAKAKELKRARN